MFKMLLAFGAGWWLAKNPGAQARIVDAGGQLLDTAADQVGAKSVLPNTSIVSPEQLANCPKGYTYSTELQKCLAPEEVPRVRRQLGRW